MLWKSKGVFSSPWSLWLLLSLTPSPSSPWWHSQQSHAHFAPHPQLLPLQGYFFVSPPVPQFKPSFLPRFSLKASWDAIAKWFKGRLIRIHINLSKKIFNWSELIFTTENHSLHNTSRRVESQALTGREQERNLSGRTFTALHLNTACETASQDEEEFGPYTTVGWPVS